MKAADIRSMCSMPIKVLVNDSDVSGSSWKLEDSSGPCPPPVTLPPISFGGQLLTVAKSQQQQSYKLYMHSQVTNSWISIEDIHSDNNKFSEVVSAVGLCASQESMLIYNGWISSGSTVIGPTATVMKATLKGTHILAHNSTTVN